MFRRTRRQVEQEPHRRKEHRYAPSLPTLRRNTPGGSRLTADMGSRMAAVPLPVGFCFQRTPFCLAQPSAGLEWAAGALPRPIPVCRGSSRHGRVLRCFRIDLLKPSEASGGLESAWSRRNGVGQAVLGFCCFSVGRAKPSSASDTPEWPWPRRLDLLMDRNGPGQSVVGF